MGHRRVVGGVVAGLLLLGACSDPSSNRTVSAPQVSTPETTEAPEPTPVLYVQHALFGIGTAGGADDQEGFARELERRAGFLDEERLFELAEDGLVSLGLLDRNERVEARELRPEPGWAGQPGHA